MKLYGVPGKPDENGSVEYRTVAWQRLVKVTAVLCEDGVRRTVWAVGEPDTFFSIPATVKVKGKSVAGFLTRDAGGWEFIAYSYRKNAGVIVPLKKEED